MMPFLRFVKSDSDMLYKTVLIAVLLNIVIYGIL